MSNPAIAARMGELIANESVQKALAVAKEEAPRALAEQIAIAQIPSPTFEETRRAEEIARLLREYGLTDVVIDPSGNVVGRRPGRGTGPVVAIAAHTDTVFPMETDVTVRSEGNLHYGPGIGDNASGLRSMLQVLRMLEAAKIETAGDILFVGTVGEEGNGDIRGAKALFDGSRKIDAFVALDMETVARVQTGATGAHRWRLAVDGPGGHSWLDYGRVPSAVHAIGRAIAKIANLELPEDPKTSYTVGTIKGGTTVNTIAAHCEVDVDMRSVAMEELMKVEETILAAFEEAVAEENARWTKAPESSYVKLTKTKIGDRPAGPRPADCPAVNAALEGAKALGIVIAFVVIAGAIINAGYNGLSFIEPLGAGSSILDFADFISNSVLMPIVALLTCVFVGWIVKPKTIIDEVRVSAPFKAAPAWTIMIKYIAPVLVIIILVAYVAAQFGFFSM